MKKNSNLLPVVVIAGLGAGLVAGCCTCHTHHLASPAPIVVYAAPVKENGSFSVCPGSYAGVTMYMQQAPAIGWYPVTGCSNYSASNGGQRSDVKIEFIGAFGDSGCNSSNVTLPTPPMSSYYTFEVFFATNPPTTNYPIILNGFSSTN
jgi:hypothetical protein